MKISTHQTVFCTSAVVFRKERGKGLTEYYDVTVMVTFHLIIKKKNRKPEQKRRSESSDSHTGGGCEQNNEVSESLMGP